MRNVTHVNLVGATYDSLGNHCVRPEFRPGAVVDVNVFYRALKGKARVTVSGVAAEPWGHRNHATTSGEKLTFSSDAFSGSFVCPLGNYRP